ASRFGLLFNAVVKVPMQFLILLLGAMIFLFYQFEKPPIYFNQPAYQRAVALGHQAELKQLQVEFDDVFERKKNLLQTGLTDSSALQVRQLDADAKQIRE